jgi:hypothetical protein
MPAKVRPQRAGPLVFPSVDGRATATRPVFLASVDGVAARGLAVAVCAPDKLSRYKRSCDWLAKVTLQLTFCLSVCFGVEPGLGLRI